ncbi:glycoside hydrolase family 19 protein [Chitinivibrio alkaliphilus]|uniref:Chitinase, GH19 family n=1 Tax=Chitinivibrio alkaliphilus ACht1 TaxID=1313304 RepID=U7DDK4_9BACT|nr:glycoside hydrolase family 19 protein [Chitinivibrio alkaliphilus]ERP38971.1 Chitinase, GH19 family [Chitinivibrio alkaliphilus ACht1]
MRYSRIVVGVLFCVYTTVHALNIIDNGDGTYSVRKSELLAEKHEQMADPLYDEVKETVRTIPNEEVERIEPGRTDNPANVRRVEEIVTPEIWEYVFPRRADEYTYTGFLQAVGKFPAFCGDYDDGRDAEEVCRRVIATSFAHFAQETGMGCDYTAREEDLPRWRQGLYYVREMDHEEGDGGYNSECSEDNWQTEKWPCGVDESGNYLGYFGRGAKQLSYHYNYGPFSEVMFDGDATVLLDNPGLVADTWLNLASAIFFYVTPQPPKPSMLHVADGTWQPNEVDKEQGIKPGFGATINVINGGVECGHGERAQAVNRIRYYREFAPLFDVPIAEDEELGCESQKDFIVGGAGAMLIQWEDDWEYREERDMGNFRCQLVGYQTPESALVEGDYLRCVMRHYGDILTIIDDDEVPITIIDDRVEDAYGKRGIAFLENPVSVDQGGASIMVVTEAPAEIRLAIYDATGNLLDEQDDPRSYAEAGLFRWDLRDHRGRLVPSGSYAVIAEISFEDGRVERYKRVLGVRR